MKINHLLKFLLIVPVLSSCSNPNICYMIYGKTGVYVLKEGIESFSVAEPEYGLGLYVTFEQQFDLEQMVFNRYSSEDVYYRYYKIITCDVYATKEALLLSTTYDEEHYGMVVSEMKTYEGFNEHINWNYANYTCYLNTQIDAHVGPKGDPYTDVKLDGEEKEIHWINFVAISEEKLKIIYCGAYFRANYTSYFIFGKWSEFFNDFFSFYDWGEKSINDLMDDE